MMDVWVFVCVVDVVVLNMNEDAIVCSGGLWNRTMILDWFDGLGVGLIPESQGGEPNTYTSWPCTHWSWPTKALPMWSCFPRYLSSLLPTRD